MSAIAPIVIELLGHPRGKGRPRRDRLPNGAYVTHTPPVTAEYEANLKLAAGRVMAGRPPLDGPVKLLLEAYFPVRASWSKKRQREALTGIIRPTVVPDWNNLGGVTDALNHVAWNDDRQIVAARVVKFYDARPRIVIHIWPVHPSGVDGPVETRATASVAMAPFGAQVHADLRCRRD